MSSLASSLPAELLHMIFERLGQPAVLTAAAVSRTWRATAVREHSYYRAWTYVYPPGELFFPARVPRHPQDTDLASFAHAVYDAEQHQYALGVTIVIQMDWGPMNRADQAAQDGLDNARDLYELVNEMATQERLFIANLVVPVLRRAVARVAMLNIQVEPEFASLIVSALFVPAPLLRECTIFVWHMSEGEHPGELPPNLFAGLAPHLKEVFLAGLMLHIPQPCFANVCDLDLETPHIPGQLAAAISTFPRVRDLTLYGLHRPPEDPINDDETAFFQHLHSLHIGSCMDCHILVPLFSAMVHIPDIEIVAIRDTEALAPLLGAPTPQELCLYEYAPDDNHPVRKRRFSQLRLRLESSTSVRSLDALIDYDIVFRVLVQSAVARILSKVTIDDRLLRSLVEACPAMPLIEDLCIVMVAWSLPIPEETRRETVEHDCACPPTAFAAVNSRPPDDRVSISCPRLSTITLYAVRPSATVPTDVLLALSRTFDGQRLELVLANGLSPSDADSLEAKSAFRSVRCPIDEFRASPRTMRAARLLREAARLGDRARERSCPHS